MGSHILERIRACIRARSYDLTAHAVDEMADDNLDSNDIEHSILSGVIDKTERDDVRGPKYTIHGTGNSPFTKIGSVGRFVIEDRYLIITVYALGGNGEENV